MNGAGRAGTLRVWMLDRRAARSFAVLAALAALAALSACHHDDDATFDADAAIVATWAAARIEAPDAVLMQLWTSQVDADGRIHYADDGSLALEMLSEAKIHHPHNDLLHPRACANLWQIYGPVSDAPHQVAVKMVTEWRPGACSAIGATQPPRCLITSIWKRAIVDGAPRDGRATIKAMPIDEQGTLGWEFVIGNHFMRHYGDDCGADVLRR